MAQTSSPVAKQAPTTQDSDTGKPVAVAFVAGGEPSGWPNSVPPLNEALKIVTGRSKAPSGLGEETLSFLSSLTFAERAALHEPEPTGDAETLCWIVAVRWRLSAALALRPTGEYTPDTTALEELLAEIDGTLASIAQLNASQDADIQEACNAARTALAKDVHQLLPTTTGPGSGADSTLDDVKQLRNALKAAVTPERRPRSPLRDTAKSKKMILAIAVGLAAMTSGVVTVVRALHEETLAAVPTLPEPPPDTEILGNPESGTVIVRSTNGKPIDREALEQFKARAADRGANVQMLAPTQALVTGAKR